VEAMLNYEQLIEKAEKKFDIPRLKRAMEEHKNISEGPWKIMVAILAGLSEKEIAKTYSIEVGSVKVERDRSLKDPLKEILKIDRIPWTTQLEQKLIRAGYGIEQKQDQQKINSEISPEIFKQVLEDKIKKLTSDFLVNTKFDSQAIYVPLGLIERKEKSIHKEVTAERGSELYRANEYEISREFENDQFLTEVLLQGDSPKSRGRRIAIIGEPGSGKSTRLQQIAIWLMEQSAENYVIWISLADLLSYSLEDYLLNKWLKDALNKRETSETDQDKLVKIFNQGNVWLLLDGIDEMGLSENPLAWVNNQICGWLDQAKIIATCRINVWDGNRQALNQFDVYRNLDFSDDQRNEFITKLLDNSKLSEDLINELGQPGKERISDLVKNPLRLTLICRSWQKRQGKLPDTKAGLYQECVEAYYDWKEEPKTTKAQRKKLNKALGELAKQALDRDDFRFRLTEAQISEVLGESDEGLFKLALDLGWLNEIGEAKENYQKIYAFFHPSFQEYFAALAIDKSEFLLNHIPDNPQKGIYRLFESKWFEIALLWIGLPSIDNDQKNKLIKQLVGFDCQPKSAYIYQIRALIIATELISEFYDCEIVNTILDYGISYAFGDWNEESKELVQYPKSEEFRNKLGNCSHPLLLKKLEDKLEFLSENVPDCKLYELYSLGKLIYFLAKNKANKIVQKIINNYPEWFDDKNYTIDDYHGLDKLDDYRDFIRQKYGEDYGSPEYWEQYEKIEINDRAKKYNLDVSVRQNRSQLYIDYNFAKDEPKVDLENVIILINDLEWIISNNLDNPVIIDLFNHNPSYLFTSDGLRYFLEDGITRKNNSLINIIKDNLNDFDSDENYSSHIENEFSICLCEMSKYISWEVCHYNELYLIEQEVEYDYFRYKNPEKKLSINDYLEMKKQLKFKELYSQVPENIFTIAIATTNLNIFLMAFDFIIYLAYCDNSIYSKFMNRILSKFFSFDIDCYIDVKIADYISDRISYAEFYSRWLNNNRSSDQIYLNQQIINQTFSLSVKTDNLNSITDEAILLRRFKTRLIESIPTNIKSKIQILIDKKLPTKNAIIDDLIVQIEDIILFIKNEIQIEKLDLFLDNKNPSQLLLELCEQFNDLVNIEWNR
jgi:energy-coupling factor transporter ATP-binding protein EcfA2